jgi:CheY-like chemotaxis protein
MEAIGRLAAGVAHDFNNINTAVVGYANLLRLKMNREDPLREYVEQILMATERAADLTRSLLAFSRKHVVNLRPVNLNDILRGMERLMKGLIGDAIELRLSLAADDLMVSGDQVQLERIITNLVSNARDAMPEGGSLTVETRQIDIDDQFIAAHRYGKFGSYALVTVTDTGTGMDESLVQKIFEPFFTTKAAGKGAGFGLSIVYDIVKQHRGYVNVTSTPGKGTSFNLYLPLVNTTTTDRRLSLPEAPARQSETVLVADNDREERNFIKAALEGTGYTVIEAVDGEDALEKFSRHADTLHCVILDIIMPKMNGKEACQAIRRTRADIKVLFTSSYPEDIIVQKGLLESSMNFILKPFSSKELIDRLAAMFR